MQHDVALRWSGSMRIARLGPITGRTELAPVDTGVGSAIALADAALRVPVDGGAGPEAGRPDAWRGDGALLASADRDRILARVYLSLYGRSVRTTLTCGDCSRLFDLDIDLPHLVEHCSPRTDPDEVAAWRLRDVVVRSPTGADELAVLDASHPGDALLSLVTDGAAATPDDRAEVAALLERVAPMLSSPVGATCPECEADQSVTFDLQRYLLGRMVMDRSSVLADVHLLASTYHWGRTDILDLERSERRAYVALIVDSRPARTADRVR